MSGFRISGSISGSMELSYPFIFRHGIATSTVIFYLNSFTCDCSCLFLASTPLGNRLLLLLSYTFSFHIMCNYELHPMQKFKKRERESEKERKGKENLIEYDHDQREITLYIIWNLNMNLKW